MLTSSLASLIVISDQIIKYLIRFSFSPGESKTILASFFNLTYVRNTGAVWGWFQYQNDWLAFVSLAVLFLIIFFYYYLVGARTISAVAIGCITGGILGNLIDRLRLGWVTDFLDFYWNDSHWPAFNLADTAICFGVCLYLIVGVHCRRRARPGT